MKHRYLIHGALLLGGLAMAGTILASTPAASMLSNACAGCHGSYGSSRGPATPSIAGISKDYFIEAMVAYKGGERPATVMSRIAKGYSDEEIALMADYFSRQKFVRIPQQTDAKLAAEGGKLHQKYCEKCHEEGGRSSEDDAGILAGQMVPYLRYSLSEFLAGSRETPKKMKKKLETLYTRHGDDGIDKLMHYYGSQH